MFRAARNSWSQFVNKPEVILLTLNFLVRTEKVYGSRSIVEADKAVLETQFDFHCPPNVCCHRHLPRLQQNPAVQAKEEPAIVQDCQKNTDMTLRRLRVEHYRVFLVIIPLSAAMFGAYQQFLWDQESATYRNKSKLFGGRQFPEGVEAWK